MKKQYLSTSEVADILGISRIAVFKKIKNGKIPANKVGRNYIIDRKDISLALSEDVTEKDRQFISDTTGRVLKDYGEVIRRLSKE